MSEKKSAAPATTIEKVIGEETKPCGQCVKTDNQQNVTLEGTFANVTEVWVLIAETTQELDSCLTTAGVLCADAKKATLNVPSNGKWRIDLKAVKHNSDSNCDPRDATRNYSRAWGKHSGGYVTANCTFYAWTELPMPPGGGSGSCGTEQPS